MQYLNDILKKFGIKKQVSNNIKISDISIDSNKICKNGLFIALKGEKTHGLMFSNTAVKNGAVYILSEPLSKISKNIDIPIIFAEKLREKLGPVCNWFYNEPSKKMKLIGVTGTNGKTTICYFLYTAIMAEFKRAGLLGTIETKLNKSSKSALRTTMEAPELHKTLNQMVEEKIPMCALEVSSQAISQNRINGTKFELCVFTNLSQDHLDYHKTMNNYFNEKARIFTPEFTKKALISIDDSYGEKLFQKCKNDIDVQTFSAIKKSADWNFTETNNGFSIKNKSGQTINGSTELFGTYNKIDAALAIISAKICGLKNPEIPISKLNNIPGRSEVVNENPKIIIDYAHTPDAIKEILTELKKDTTGNLICVSGAGGEREHEKRPKMSRIIFKLSDYYVITDDNYRSENPDTIRTELENAISGEKDFSKKVFNVKNRKKGIKKAIELVTSKNDTVAILGKGHENYIITNKGYEKYNDKEAALFCLKYLYI